MLDWMYIEQQLPPGGKQVLGAWRDGDGWHYVLTMCVGKTFTGLHGDRIQYWSTINAPFGDADPALSVIAPIAEEA